MATKMKTPWPPPPDLASLAELIANADVEGFIASGSPSDEYETEAEDLFHAIDTWPTADLITEGLLPVIEEVWVQNFSLSETGLAARRVKLRELAAQIERFFGPEARPQVRGA